MKSTLLFLTILLLPLMGVGQTVSTVAGIPGAVGSANGPAATATFNNPHGVAVDRAGNIYIANRYAHNIRKITASGVVSTFAGVGSPGFTDGTGTAAAFNEPWALACDTAGNVYVADTKNYSIRKITPAGVVTTLAGTGAFGVTNGPLLQAQFGFPSGIAVNAAGTLIYVADQMTHTIRKISGGQVTTLAGTAYLSGNTNGTGSTARFNQPYSIVLDNIGNIIVADMNNNLIRKVSPAGVVTTLAGDGTPGSNNGLRANASFNAPWGIGCDNTGNIYVGEGNNFLIRKISQDSVVTFAGQDGMPGFTNGPALQSTFNGVSALNFYPNSNMLYLCDPFSQLVRKIDLPASQTVTVATQGGVTQYCAGNQVTLIAYPSGYPNYDFYDGTTLIGSSASGTINVSSMAVGSHAISCVATTTAGTQLYSNTYNLTVYNNPTVSINVSGPTAICNGDSVVMSANASGTWQWSTGATTQTITVYSAGSYTVTVVDNNGCIASSAALQITQLQAPQATISSATSLPVCQGDSVALTASSATTYLWSTGATSQVIYATGPGNYTVLVTNGSGCSAISLPQQVAYYPATSSTISPQDSVPLVAGSSVTLTAGPGQGYIWSNGSTAQSITVSTIGVYTVTVIDNNGCNSAPATVSVVPFNSANMVMLSGPVSFCQGDSVVLSSVFPNGNQWYLNSSPIAGATGQTYIATQSGTYHLLYNAGGGNIIQSDSIVVDVLYLPVSIQALSDTVCKGSQAVLGVAPQSGITYYWYAGINGGTAVANGLSYTTPALNQPTSFWVEMVNSAGCVSNIRHEVPAALLPSPQSSFTSGVAIPATGGYQLAFTNTSSGATSYAWDFGDPASADNFSTDPDPVHIYSSTGTYQVLLITSNNYGCIDTLLTDVEVRLGNNIFIPTGFTPNSDGNNDVFRVRGNNIAFSEMAVYNAWGQRIFYSEKETVGWDGKMNGQIVPNGNYAYVITVQYVSGNKETYKGNISVIR